MKTLLSIFFLSFLAFSNSFAFQIDNSIVIEPNVDTVDFGFVLLGESTKKDFTIKNGSSAPVRFGGANKPYFLIEKNQIPDIFRQFLNFPIILPDVDIPVNVNHTISIEYTPQDTALNQLNEADGILTIGVTPISTSDIKQTKQFLLQGYRTKTFLATKRNSFKFDSVYINAALRKPFRWSLFNVSKTTITPSADISYYTPSDLEFSYASLNSIPSNDFRDVELYYSPINRGKDSARFWLRYDRASSIETLPIEISGIGVEQVITTTNVTVDAIAVSTSDNIDLGNVDWGAKKNIQIRLKNDGNIVYKIIDQKIKSFKSGIEIQTNSIITNPYPGTPIPLNDEYSITIEFSPSELGEHTTEIELLSDLATRSIFGINQKDVSKKLLIKANGIGSSLETNIDTLRMGEISVSQQSNCRLNSSKSFQIKNKGSKSLEIQSISILSSFSPFRITSTTGGKTVESDSIITVRVDFEPNSIGNFVDSLVVISNSISGKRKILFIQGSAVQARAVSPTIDEIFAKPGTEISIPIRVNSFLEGITTIQHTLQYDRSILEYKGYSSNGTKIQNIPSQFITISELPNGQLPISIVTPLPQFTNSDTLLNLVFAVYLGEKRSTPIQFINSSFGTAQCPNFLTIQSQQGKVTIDSICGLDFKTSQTTFALGTIAPNPITNFLSISLDSKENQNIEVTIYSPLGTAILDKLFTVKEGITSLLLPEIQTLHTGVYVLSIRGKNSIFQQLILKE